MRIGDDEQVQLLDPFGRLRHAGHGVAAVPHDDHRLEVIGLGHLLLGAAVSHRTTASKECRTFSIHLLIGEA